MGIKIQASWSLTNTETGQEITTLSDDMFYESALEDVKGKTRKYKEPFVQNFRELKKQITFDLTGKRPAALVKKRIPKFYNETIMNKEILTKGKLNQPFKPVKTTTYKYKVFIEPNHIDYNELVAPYNLQSGFSCYTEELALLLERIDITNKSPPHVSEAMVSFAKKVNDGEYPDTMLFHNIMKGVLFSGKYTTLSKTSKRRRKLLDINTPRNVLLGGYIDSYRVEILK